MRTLTRFLLDIPKPLMDEIILSGNLKLYMDTSFKAEWKGCCSAFAKVIPESVKGIDENDELAISYFVVADREYPHNDNSFHPVTEGQPYLEKYKNSKGWWLHKGALKIPSTGALKWYGFIQDERMEWLDGTEGTQSDVERWMGQFSFGHDDNFTYKNLIQIEGKQYWVTEDFNIFAKKVDGKITTVSDRVICKPIQQDMTDRYNIANGTVHPPFSYIGMFLDRGILVSGGEDLGLKKGDIIGFEQKFCERYTLWNRECFLIKKDRIDAIWEISKNN